MRTIIIDNCTYKVSESDLLHLEQSEIDWKNAPSNLTTNNYIQYKQAIRSIKNKYKREREISGYFETTITENGSSNCKKAEIEVFEFYQLPNHIQDSLIDDFKLSNIEITDLDIIVNYLSNMSYNKKRYHTKNGEELTRYM